VAYGYLLNGIEISLDPYVSIEATRHPESSVASGQRRRLLIVGSDSCMASRRQVEPWKALLRTLKFGREDEVLLLSEGQIITRELVTVLETGKIAYRVMRPSRMEGLMISTGILSTPFTIALDTDDRARLITRRLEGRQLSLFHSFFLREQSGEVRKEGG
jgi:hypothetical protein